MKDLGKVKEELATYTAAITLFLNLLSMGSQGRMEQHMENHSSEMRELRSSLNWIAASLQAKSGDREGSILTSYTNDDKAIWKEFRRELIKEGFSSSVLRRNKNVIKDYVLELGARGALDNPDHSNIPVLDVFPVMEQQDVLWGQECDGPPRDAPDENVQDVAAVQGPNLSQHTSNDQRSRFQTPEDDMKSLKGSFFSVRVNRSDLESECAASAKTGNDNAHGSPVEECRNGKMSPDEPPIYIPEAIETINFLASSTDKVIPPMPLTPDGFGSNEHNMTASTPVETSNSSRDDPITVTNSPRSLSACRNKPGRVSVEEIEDEDFQTGSHPNCLNIPSTEDTSNEVLTNMHTLSFSPVEQHRNHPEYESFQNYGRSHTSADATRQYNFNLPEKSVAAVGDALPTGTLLSEGLSSTPMSASSDSDNSSFESRRVRFRLPSDKSLTKHTKRNKYHRRHLPRNSEKVVKTKDAGYRESRDRLPESDSEEDLYVDSESNAKLDRLASTYRRSKSHRDSTDSPHDYPEGLNLWKTWLKEGSKLQGSKVQRPRETKATKLATGQNFSNLADLFKTNNTSQEPISAFIKHLKKTENMKSSPMLFGGPEWWNQEISDWSPWIWDENGRKYYRGKQFRNPFGGSFQFHLT
jgi:hypothetical protein